MSALAHYESMMPAVFIGHGNPMNAIEDTKFSRAWSELGLSLPRPQAILCISAHWETAGTFVTAMERPKTIHDFRGFPPELFEKSYPAPGSPELARLVQETVSGIDIQLDHHWGLDHGAWSVLCRMFPDGDIPVVQLSMDRKLPPAGHYAIGQALRSLRHQGVLVIGSGNIVHNLGKVIWDDSAYDWAKRFNDRIVALIAAGDHAQIINYPQLGDEALWSVPTAEHFLPLLYILGLKDADEDVDVLTNQVTLGAISMTSIVVGAQRQS